MFVSLLALLVVSLPSSGGTQPPNASSSATVISVVDGDTFDANIQGKKYRVRLIGVDTPETKHPTKQIACYGPEASRYLSTLLPKGIKVVLRLDKEWKDKYGRMLAYVYVNNLFVNLNLVEKGFAVPMKYYPNVTHANEFQLAADKAQASNIGRWKVCK